MLNNHVDWAILGGGKNGVNLAAALTQKGIPTNEIKIIDRQAEPLQLWFEMTQQVGMEHLRSPINQHLGDSHDSLEAFCDTYTPSQPDATPAYDPQDPHKRVTLKVFNAYLQAFLEKYQIKKMFVQGDVKAVTANEPDGFNVTYDTPGTPKTESLNADHLVLAIGYHDNRFIPQWQVTQQPDAPKLEPDFAWIQTLKQSGASVHHIYEPGFNVDTITPCESIIVVGGGFSGVQLALKLVEKNLAKHVTLLVEQPIQVHEFDADTVWANPNSRQMQQFLKANHTQRRATIQQERHPGSINTPLSHRLSDAIAAKKIQLVIGKTTTADFNNQHQQITLHLTPLKGDVPSTLQANQVLLATGYRLTKKPGGPWLTALEKALQLPTHDDYPVLNDNTLQWGNRQLYVAGQMAELSLGPLARNIAGVKLSTDKIVNSPAAQRSSTRYKVVTFQGQRSKRLHRVA